MKLFVGLGNPGKEYENTRHNVGFMLVNRMERSGWLTHKNGLFVSSWLNQDALLVKPQLFMNRSGEAVTFLAKKHALAPEDIGVIHDDPDISLGEYKLQLGKGPKVHNGLNSIIETLDSDQFWRARIGIESRVGGSEIPGKAFVLQAFPESEAVSLLRVFEALETKIMQDFINA